MCSAGGCSRFARASFLIRRSPDQRLLTTSRGFSQFPTSFIGTWRQGIHRKPLVASPRDTEKSILFWPTSKRLVYQLLFSCKGAGSPLTGERCSSRLPSNLGAFVKGIGCLSRSSFVNLQKTTRQTAGPQSAARCLPISAFSLDTLLPIDILFSVAQWR
jgi:hypothetical protein